jgi:hypothetical protein
MLITTILYFVISIEIGVMLGLLIGAILDLLDI